MSIGFSRADSEKAVDKLKGSEGASDEGTFLGNQIRAFNTLPADIKPNGSIKTLLPWYVQISVSWYKGEKVDGKIKYKAGPRARLSFDRTKPFQGLEKITADIEKVKGLKTEKDCDNFKQA